MPSDPRAPVIHIGYHKTATTWFQRHFYPAVRSGCFLPRDLVRDTLIAPRAYEFSAECARATLERAAGGQRILMCEENLSGYLHNGGLGGLLTREIAQRLFDCFPDATILVFLRAQPGIFLASYAQYVRGGGTHSIERYLLAQERARGARKYWYKVPLFSWQHFNYAPVLDHYCQLFGRDCVHISLYEAFAADNLAILRTLAAALALDVDWSALAASNANPSLSPAELAILRRLNLFTARSVADKNYFVASGWWYKQRWRALRWLRHVPVSSRSVTLSAALRERIVQYFRRSNTEIAARYGLPLERYGYPLEQATCATGFPERSSPDILAAAGTPPR